MINNNSNILLFTFNEYAPVKHSVISSLSTISIESNGSNGFPNGS